MTNQPRRIIVGGKKLIFYDSAEPTDSHLADEEACIAVIYNPVFYCFITAHPKCIKLWDAETGTLKSVYKDISTRDITSICHDERKRKLFIGDQRGRVYCINVKNGVVTKRFKKGRDEVRFGKTKDEGSKTKKEDVSSLIY